MNEVILIGGFEETIELCELCGYKIIGIVDNKKKEWKYPYLGTDKDVIGAADVLSKYPVVLAPDQPLVRKRLASLYQNAGFRLKALISPKAFIAPSVQLAEGCIIQSFCNVSTNVRLGECVKVNTYANIMHDVKIDNYVTVAPNAVILGLVKIAECAYVGANSTIIQTNTVGREAIIGAGAVVTKDVCERTTVIGVPARELRVHGEGNDI